MINRFIKRMKAKVLVSRLCPTLCNPLDCSLPGSSVHGILQARILAWVAISFSRESSQPRKWTQDSRTAGIFFTVWATREAQLIKRMQWLKFIIYPKEFQELAVRNSHTAPERCLPQLCVWRILELGEYNNWRSEGFVHVLTVWHFSSLCAFPLVEHSACRWPWG